DIIDNLPDEGSRGRDGITARRFSYSVREPRPIPGSSTTSKRLISGRAGAAYRFRRIYPARHAGYNGTAMGQFRVTARLTGSTGRTESVELLVDTGATFLVVPQAIADRLDIAPQRQLPVVIAGGTRMTWPVGEIRVAIEGQETTTPCFIAPSG